MTPISLITTEEIDGEIKLNPSWAELSDIARMDLLLDWIGVLEQLKDLVHHDLYGSGYEYKDVCVDAIKSWKNHGKGPEYYKSAMLKLVQK